MYQKKVVILGRGNIGSEFAKLWTAFGAQVSHFKRGDNLQECVRDADIVANCLSANPSTEKILDTKFFESMKEASIFVCIARSSTYDTEALISAIESGRIQFALDDGGTTPPGEVNAPEYQALLKSEKIFVTPHISWNCDTERRTSGDMMIDNIESYLKGTPINLVE